MNQRPAHDVTLLLSRVAEGDNSAPGNVNYATAIMIQGLIYSRTNRTGEAEGLLREAVKIRAENLPETHFLRAAANGALGEFLTSQRKYAEAEPFEGSLCGGTLIRIV